MKDPNINTKVTHSLTKAAWNVVGTQLGGKFKICRVPYLNSDIASDSLNEKNRLQAYEHAEFISYCFNHSYEILTKNMAISAETKP